MSRSLLAGLLLLTAVTVRAETAVDAAIWPRIASGMHLNQAPRPEIDRWIALYAARPAALTRMLERASPFLHFIVESAELRELPMELALLPAVESGFDAHARSRSSATGLWQFVPVTGRAYGLGENRSYDGRRDPVASTRAALTHLQDLHAEFGDWLLALAAYNAGAGTLRRAIRETSSQDFWRLPLRQETRDYVPKLLALAALVRSPERYGLQLPEINRSDAPALVTLDRRLPLERTLKAAQVDPELLRRFNPGLKRTDHAGSSPALLLPAADALVVRAELAQAQRQLESPSPPAPVFPDRAPMLVARLAAPDPLGLRRVSGGGGAEPTPAPPVADLPPSDGEPRRHRVRRGETLFAISREYGVSVEALREANGLGSDDVLSAGRELRIPTEVGR